MDILQTISAVVLVFGLLGALYWFANRYGGRLNRISNRRIRIVEKMSLGDRRSLLLVEIGRRSYLLGSTSQSISLLAPLEEVVPVEEGEDADEKDSNKQLSFKRALEMIR